MDRCPVCSAELTGSGIRCPACGASLTVAHPTLKQPPAAASGGQRKSTNSATTSSSQGSFIAGTVLDGRYRIVALLGRGGMGEVYKAEDLKLDHEVALKFLPDSFANDSAALARFRSEVRIARQVTHQNVCRVFDIGEFEGRHFLSMEFIDGEDLSSLLRRIGRLPSDKALEVSRQICAGLAAAHGAGVLHRDLKPANVMIDGRGKARITDFGIAGLEEELKKGGVIAGTPAYMSPEQITGKEITAQSDIYSLGLVLYELFTGKPAFQSDSISELVHKHQTITPTNPSEILKEIDPLVEKTILRCLEKDPQQRPASALQVAAMLPGGDPLAAALAAGETPSPEMVAAAPTEGALKPAVALACLLGGIAMLAIFTYASMKLAPHNRIPFNKSPEVLSERANEIVAKLGYPDAPGDTNYSFDYDESYFDDALQNSSPEAWSKLSSGQPLIVVFRERQSPHYMETLVRGGGNWIFEPQMDSGMRTILLDTRGRLVQFSAVPPQFTDNPKTQTQTDWSPAFSAAELDQSRFKETAPKWTPPSAYDARIAWEGMMPDHPEIPLRVEAAAFQGKIVSFQLIYPWTKPNVWASNRITTRTWVGTLIFAGLAIGILVTAIFLARRNVKSGSGDRKGAFKISLVVLILTFCGIFLGINHVPSFFPELDRYSHAIRQALYFATATWLLYLALEPYVRRNLPELIVSWNRLLAGDWRDPLVGRDVLIGTLFGIGQITLIHVGDLAERYFNNAALDLSAFRVNNSLAGLRISFANVLFRSSLGIGYGFMAVFFLVILFLIFRRRLYAEIVIFGVYATITTLLFKISLVFLPFSLVIAVMIAVLWARFGLVATVISAIVFFWLERTLFTFNLSAWYASGMFLTLFLILLLLGYGFKISLANRPLLGNRLANE
jgi:serine/threonine protein kinase